MRDIKTKYDFGAYATRYNIKCADGRTILNHAFDDDDGHTVPLIWNHNHDDPYAVIGHALLEKRDDGVYSYISFNESELAKHCKELVEHGDITGVSIYANKLKQNEGNVHHGIIRELSLVLAGANPGAYIDAVLAHKDDLDDALVSYNTEDSFETSEEDENENEKEESTEETTTESDEKKEEEIEHSDKEDSDKKDEEDNGDTINIPQTLESIEKKLSPIEMKTIMALIGAVYNDAKGDEKGDNMKYNAFENDTNNKDAELMHDALKNIWEEGRRCGHLKDACLAHADELANYGIDNIEYLQAPEGTDIYDRPMIVNTHPNGWISKIINGVTSSPVAKVRMMFADITVQEARAKGYIKGNYKEESFFGLQKRTVSPTTVYVKQKFDRDDITDADFDVVPYAKKVMDIKMDEELARAYIFGDGRSNSDNNKVNEANIIPVVKEDEFFLITSEVDAPASTSKSDWATFAENVIDEMNLAQDDYVGSGNLTAFVVSKVATKMLLLKDQFGHRLYKTMAELASAMGVNEVVKVPASVMPADHYVVALDLADYQVGKKNMGNKAWYNDFDIDYNQEKFLLETRRSGALVMPKSAIVIKKTQAAG